MFPRTLALALALLVLATTASAGINTILGFPGVDVSISSKASLAAYTNVTVLLGNLKILASTLCTSSVDLTEYNLLVSTFSQLTEIRGYLSIVGGSCIPDLLFLKNLVVIRGESLVPCSTSVCDYTALYIDQGGVTPSSATNALRLFGLLSLTTVRGGGIYLPYASIVATGATKWSGLCGRRNVEQDLQGADWLLLAAPGSDTDSVALATQQYRHNITRTLASGFSFRIYWQQDQRDMLTNVSKCAVGGTDPFCHSSCNGRCWLPNDATACQKVCSSNCGDAGCSDGDWSVCCSSTCMGGCFSDGRCKACADGYLLREDGTCSATCPSGQLQSGLGRTLTCGTRYVTYFKPIACVRSCPSNTYSNGTHCNLYCDGGADPVNGMCPPTAGPYKVCTSVYGISNACEFALLGFEDCDTLQGSVELLATSGIDTLTPTTLAAFKRLRYIMGYLVVFQSQFQNLNFLSNLERIGGYSVYGPDVVLIRQNNGMTSLGLSSLRNITGPSGSRVTVKDNLPLCYVNSINFTELTLSIPNVVLNMVFDTSAGGYIQAQLASGTINHVVADYVNKTVKPECSVVSCDSFCQPRGCWDGGATSCQRCAPGLALLNGACVSDALNYTGYYLKDWAFYPCHSSCKSCAGGLSTQCLTCAASDNVLRSDGSCSSTCGSVSQFVDASNVCQPCASECAECVTSSSQCTVCSAAAGLHLAGNTCVSTCPNTSYVSSANVCAACSSSCLTCSGSSTSCTSCDVGSYLYVDPTTGARSCVSSCAGAFYGNSTSRTCQPCNSLCSACSGPSNSQCTACVSSAYKSGTSTCVADCPVSTFGDTTNRTCNACPDQCSECFSLQQTLFCTGCTNSYYFYAAKCVSTCPSGYYGAGSTTTDRACLTCSSCSAGSYIQTPCGGTTNTVCGTCSTCQAGEYQQTACTSTANTVCKAITACNSSQYQVVGATATSNAVCSSLTSCTSQQYESKAPTPTSDRVCSSLSICRSTEFESRAPTLTSDRVCSACSTCSSGTFETAQCSTSADRVCTSCSTCSTGTYAKQACSGTSDTLCASVTSCGSQQYQVSAATPTSNTVCATITTCSSNQYERVPPASLTDRICGACDSSCLTCDRLAANCTSCDGANNLHFYQNTCVSVCPDSTYVTFTGACAACSSSCLTCSGSSTSCTSCDVGSYLYVDPTTGARSCVSSCAGAFYGNSTSRTCQPCNSLCSACSGPSNSQCTACVSSAYKSGTSTCVADCPVSTFGDTTNRTCNACPDQCSECFSLQQTLFCTGCTNSYYFYAAKCVSTCPSGYYGAGSTTTDRACLTCSSCSAGSYIQTPCGGTTNTVCGACSTCQAGEYQQTACTSTANTVCKAISTCASTQYLVVPASPTSDAICFPVTSCTSQQYESKAPTPTSDRVCSSLSICRSTEFESRAPTLTSDRVCGVCNSCSSGTFEVSPCSSSSNRACQLCTQCSPGTYAKQTCSSSSDTVCSPVTTCSVNQYLSVPATPFADNVCVSIRTCVSGEFQFAAPTTTSDRICAACDSTCATCAGSSSNCTSCDTNLNMHYYQGTCVSSCPPSTFISTTSACAACSSNCLTCSGTSTSCDSCKTGTFLFIDPKTGARSCVPTCLGASYGNSTSRECLACDTLCGGCSGPSNTECSSCVSSAFSYGSSTCLSVADCPVATYGNLQNRTCSDCPSNCASCFSLQSALFCTGCLNWKYFHASKCVDVCPTGFFGAGSNADDRACVACTACPSGSYEQSPCTSTSDRVCATCAQCASGTYRANNCTNDSDTVCKSISVCSSNQYLQAPATPTSNNVCVNYTVCSSNQYEAEAPTSTSDRVCRNAKICNPSSHYESRPKTTTSDRNCTLLRICLDTEIQTKAPTATSDRVCTRFDPCASSPCIAGTCVPKSGEFSCKCDAGFTGDLCEENLNKCSPGTCQNGGICRIKEGYYQCQCPTGTCGSSCETFDNGNGDCADASQSATTASSTGVIVGSVVGGIMLVILLLFFVLRARRTTTKTLGGSSSSSTVTLVRSDHWEIPRTALTLGKVIGAGNFGEVHKGMLMDQSGGHGKDAVDVAIKMLKPSATGTQSESEFFEEMALMKEIGKHPNVISLVGVVTVETPRMLVVEYADFGDLKTFLRDRRATDTRPAQLSNSDLLLFALQVSAGMEYLSSMKIVHRDLAARNVLVCFGPTCKISDFGLARDVYEEDFYKKTSKGAMAFKWMAPESLADRVFTSQSDVWSFGVLLWEIYSFAAAPYPSLNNEDVLGYLQRGGRMSRPDDCPNAVDAVMQDCWLLRPTQRPSFTVVKTRLAAAATFDVTAFMTPFVRKSSAVHSISSTSDGAYLEPTSLSANEYENDGNDDFRITRAHSARTVESLSAFRPLVLPSKPTTEPAYDVATSGHVGHVYGVASATASPWRNEDPAMYGSTPLQSFSEGPDMVSSPIHRARDAARLSLSQYTILTSPAGDQHAYAYADHEVDGDPNDPAYVMAV